jgi:hypothetical protein
MKNRLKTAEMRINTHWTIPFWEELDLFCINVGRILINHLPGAENRKPIKKSLF